jgi:hypothetical protein
METITISNIKKVEDKCAKLCKESVQVWIELMRDPKMKGIEAKLREVIRAGARANKKCGNYTATSRAYDNHFGSATCMCRSGETEGPTKYPAIETRTKVRRSNKDHWIIGHCSR